MAKKQEDVTVWTDKDGTKIKIVDMDTRHLNSVICLIEKYAVERAEKIPKRLVAAITATTNEVEKLKLKKKLRDMLENGIDPNTVYPQYNNLCLEQQNRYNNN